MNPIRSWIMVAAFSMNCGFAGADEILVPNSAVVAQNSRAVFELLVTNAGTAPLAFEVPSTLKVRLHAGSETADDVSLVLDGDAGARTVAPGGFLKVAYTASIPPGFAGPVMLEPTNRTLRPVMFSVEPERIAVAASAGAVGKVPPAESSRGIRRATALRRSTRLLNGVSPYEPVYFAIGASDGLNAKFQLSLKYNPFDVWPFYLGYTQTSLWDLHSTSKPFRDTAYRPSLFYLNENVWNSAGRSFRFGWQGGLEHESNGKGGIDSRSINTVFVRPRFEWQLGGGRRLILSPKFYGYVDKSENPDIPDYRGYCDFLVSYLWQDWRLSLTARRGMKAHNGSLQIDAVLPLRTSEDLLSRVGVPGVNGYLFVQYFNGWGESILDYKRKLHSQVRAGVMIVP